MIDPYSWPDSTDILERLKADREQTYRIQCMTAPARLRGFLFITFPGDSRPYPQVEG